MLNFGNIVSKNDTLTLLEIIQDCLCCVTVEDAHSLITKTCTLIDVNNAVYGLARLDGNGSIEDYKIMNFSYPLEWLQLYRQNEFHKQDPIALENFSHFGVQYWADTYNKYQVDKKFLLLSEDYGLRDGYASGIINQSRTEGCLLSLAGKLTNHPRHAYILNNLTPHLHCAFAKILQEQNKPKKNLVQISEREKEVLNWVKHGKSTWDISAILSVSERTVKFHINNIMTKLDAVSRTHAVAIALGHGLIGYP